MHRLAPCNLECAQLLVKPPSDIGKYTSYLPVTGIAGIRAASSTASAYVAAEPGNRLWGEASKTAWQAAAKGTCTDIEMVTVLVTLVLPLLLLVGPDTNVAATGYGPVLKGRTTFYGGAPDHSDPNSPSWGTLDGSCGYALCSQSQFIACCFSRLLADTHECRTLCRQQVCLRASRLLQTGTCLICCLSLRSHPGPRAPGKRIKLHRGHGSTQNTGAPQCGSAEKADGSLLLMNGALYTIPHFPIAS